MHGFLLVVACLAYAGIAAAAVFDGKVVELVIGTVIGVVPFALLPRV